MVLIELTDVYKSYQLGKRTVEALQGISLTVAAGDFLALVGPSGSGKTTLMNILSLIDRPDRGAVHFKGKPTEDLNDDALTEFRNRHIGIIFQSFNLIPVLSALENVSLAMELSGTKRAEAEQRADAELRRVGLKDFISHRPDELSGGQRQRVAIARALVTRPDVVFADEPTAALDSQTAHEIIGLMRSLNQELGTTFLFSTHDLRLLDETKRTLEIADGRLVEHGASMRVGPVLPNRQAS